MSTAPAHAAAVMQPPREVVVVSHSTLFYWWPVWVIGYLMALFTLVNHELMVTVPAGTKLDVKDGRDALVAPNDKVKLKNPSDGLWMSTNKSLGAVYAIALVLVIVITNVQLRGLWSVVIIVVIVLGSIIFALTHVWDIIFEAFDFLDIRINFAGYLFISTVLLAMWLVVFFFFDRQVYMVFTPGNVRLQLEIGGGETTYDTIGMTVQKQRNDLFRHWILGLGSGDLIVKTAGAASHTFDLPNVLSLGRRVREIEELMRMKEIVAAPPGH
jgi:hypothetical protein